MLDSLHDHTCRCKTNPAGSWEVYFLAAFPRQQFNQATGQDLFSSSTSSVKEAFYNSCKRPDAIRQVKSCHLHPEHNNQPLWRASPVVPVGLGGKIWKEIAAAPLQVTGVWRQGGQSALAAISRDLTAVLPPHYCFSQTTGEVSSGRMILNSIRSDWPPPTTPAALSGETDFHASLTENC